MPFNPASGLSNHDADRLPSGPKRPMAFAASVISAPTPFIEPPRQERPRQRMEQPPPAGAKYLEMSRSLVELSHAHSRDRSQGPAGPPKSRPAGFFPSAMPEAHCHAADRRLQQSARLDHRFFPGLMRPPMGFVRFGLSPDQRIPEAHCQESEYAGNPSGPTPHCRIQPK